MTMHTYTREGDHLAESVTVHVDESGYIRMTARNLHEVLTHLGYVPVGVSPLPQPAIAAR